MINPTRLWPQLTVLLGFGFAVVALRVAPVGVCRDTSACFELAAQAALIGSMESPP